MRGGRLQEVVAKGGSTVCNKKLCALLYTYYKLFTLRYKIMKIRMIKLCQLHNSLSFYNFGTFLNKNDGNL